MHVAQTVKTNEKDKNIFSGMAWIGSMVGGRSYALGPGKAEGGLFKVCDGR